MSETRKPHVFKRDSSGHWYMIPASKQDLFDQLVSDETKVFDFLEEFDSNMIDGPLGIEFYPAD